MPHAKCNVLDRSKEKALSRIATRGVVKFFNVCNQEQKQIETKLQVEAGPSMRKRDKVLSSIDKGSFLDRLKDATESEDESDDAQKPTWSVLRNDFVMGAKLKSWKRSDDEEEDDDDDEADEEEAKTAEKNAKKPANKNKRLKK